jgi:hypothetical protein
MSCRILLANPDSRTAGNDGHYGIEMPVPNVGVLCESGDEQHLHCGFMLRAKVHDLPKIQPVRQASVGDQ